MAHGQRDNSKTKKTHATTRILDKKRRTNELEFCQTTGRPTPGRVKAIPEEAHRKILARTTRDDLAEIYLQNKEVRSTVQERMARQKPT